jgi:hypothetical protein
VKEICPTCGAAVDVGGVASSLLAIMGGANLTVRCPGCSTEIALAAREPEPYDPGPIDDDDPLAPWHRDRARGISASLLPRYDNDRRTWTVYGDDVDSYTAAIARIDNVKAGLSPDGDRIQGWLAYFLDPDTADERASEPLRPGRATAKAWGVDVDQFVDT